MSDKSLLVLVLLFILTLKLKSLHLLPILYQLFTSLCVGDLKMLIQGSHRRSTWMYYKLTNLRLFYKIEQTRQAYVFWNAPDRHRMCVHVDPWCDL